MTLIKWTGSKRPIAKEIISHFPKDINCYYEPFLGGGSVFFELLKSDIQVKSYFLTDMNESLIKIFNLVKDDPKTLIDGYTHHWNILQSKPSYYYEKRKEYNEHKCPILFYFLTRTCYNGTIRYNGKGEFNTSHHFGRPGMSPNKVSEIINLHHDLMKDKDIHIVSSSFEKVLPLYENDVMYLDPPYTNTKALYYGNIDFKEFLKWLDAVPCSWFLNINGFNKTDNEENISIPFTERKLLNSGNSSFSRIKGSNVNVSEYFYYRLKNEFK